MLMCLEIAALSYNIYILVYSHTFLFQLLKFLNIGMEVLHKREEAVFFWFFVENKCSNFFNHIAVKS